MDRQRANTPGVRWRSYWGSSRTRRVTARASGCVGRSDDTEARCESEVASVDQTEARCAELKAIVCVRPPACRAGPKCRPAKPVQSGGWESLGLVPGSPIVTSIMSERGPLCHAKDSSRRVQRPGVEPFNLHRRRRSRPTAKRLRPPPLHPQGRRGQGKAALSGGFADTTFCRGRSRLLITGRRGLTSLDFASRVRRGEDPAT